MKIQVTMKTNKHISKSLLAGVTLLGAGISHAAIVNQFTFNDSTVTDSVGGTTATLVGGAAVTGTGATGVLNLTGGRLDLANGMFTGAASGGTAGQVTIALWAQATTNTNWAAVASFGPGPAGSNTPNPSTQDYVQVIAQHGAGGATLRTTTHAANNGTEGFVDGAAALSTASMQHLVTTYNAGTGNVEFFVDGASQGTATIATGLNINTFADNANNLGQSQWADPAFQGQITEFTVYDTALSAAEVTAAFNAGPITAVPEPTSTALLGLGGLALILRRRK